MSDKSLTPPGSPVDDESLPSGASTPEYARSPVQATPIIAISLLKRRVHVSRNPSGRPQDAASKAESVSRRERNQRQLANMSDAQREEYLARRRFTAHACRAKLKVLQGDPDQPANSSVPKESSQVRQARMDLFDAVNDRISTSIASGTLTAEQIIASLPDLLVELDTEIHRFVAEINSGLSAAALADVLAKNSLDHEKERTNRKSFGTYTSKLIQLQSEIFSDNSPNIKFELFQDTAKVIKHIQTKLRRKDSGALLAFGTRLGYLGAICSVGSRVKAIKTTSYGEYSRVFAEMREQIRR